MAKLITKTLVITVSIKMQANIVEACSEGVDLLSTFYPKLFSVNFTSVSVIFTLTYWVISRRNCDVGNA
jgi:hypothetical protein